MQSNRTDHESNQIKSNQRIQQYMRLTVMDGSGQGVKAIALPAPFKLSNYRAPESEPEPFDARDIFDARVLAFADFITFPNDDYGV